MKWLNPKNWTWSNGKKGSTAGAVTQRDQNAEGPYSTLFENWVAREVNPYLYEGIREACAPVDGAINRLVTLDGIIKIEGDNDSLVQELQDWADNVRVNDLEQGFQAFYRSQGNEMYEQGFTVGGMTVGDNDVSRLRVADSKGVGFQREKTNDLSVWYRKPSARSGRRDGTDQVERVIRNNFAGASSLGALDKVGYQQLNRDLLAYACFNPEADGPYGTSIMRSTEFDARVLLTMKNSLHQVWERFGNPAFKVTYKTKARKTQTELDARSNDLASNLSKVLSIKQSGNSADFVNAIGKDDELEIAILGADGAVLEIEAPARHVLESIVSKTGLPSWMLGFHWSTAERLAQRQGEIALQESKTRFTTRLPGLNHVVATMLRARGRTWKKDDWLLVQELPSLQDLVAQAQAVFLYTQSAAVLEGAGLSLADMESMAKQAGIGSLLPEDGIKALSSVVASKMGKRGELVTATGKKLLEQLPRSSSCSGHKSEDYVEDGAALMRLERQAESGLLSIWADTEAATLEALGIDAPKSAKAPSVFLFDSATMMAALLKIQDELIAKAGAADGPLIKAAIEAWGRGVKNAADEFEGVDAVEDQVRQTVADAMQTAGMAQVRDTAIRVMRDDIIKDLADGAYNGQNPLDVARELRKRFSAKDYDWERLARSEIANAQVSGKMEQYAAHGVSEYDWVKAGDSCPICSGLAAGGPYPVGSGPLPVTDSHPNCRCTAMAAA